MQKEDEWLLDLLDTSFTYVSDMEVVKVGGPIYRIGLGGGAASSIQVQGDNQSELDFGAVQRGDAEMEQKMNRIIRGCIEMDEANPICSIHDQGAGGNGEYDIGLFPPYLRYEYEFLHVRIMQVTRQSTQ